MCIRDSHQLHQMTAIEGQLAQAALGGRQRGNAQGLAEFGKHLGELRV